MILSLEDEVRVEIIKELRRKNPKLEKENPKKFNKLYNQEQQRRIDARRSIKNRHPLNIFFERWLRKYTNNYESFSREEQKKRDQEVLNKLAIYCCGHRRTILEGYKIYWRQVKKYRKH